MLCSAYSGLWAKIATLVVAKGYLGRLLGNDAVKRFLKNNQPEILAEFEALVATVALDDQFAGAGAGAAAAAAAAANEEAA